MSGAIKRAQAAAEKRADALRERVRARIVAALPGVTVRAEGEQIVLSGRGLVRRWVGRDELRDFGDISREGGA